MFHTVSKKKFKGLEKRNALIADNNFDGLDPRIIPTIKLLQRVDGIQTVWSCSGHTIAEMHSRAKKRNKEIKIDRKVNEFYFIFAVNNESEAFFKFLSKFIEQSKRLPGYRNILQFKMDMVSLKWGFHEEHVGFPPSSPMDDYACWQFSFLYHVVNHEEYLSIITQLNTKLSKFINKQNKLKGLI